MSHAEPEPRAPIQAETKVSPLAELTGGNLYPYWDLKEGGLTPYLNAVRRTFAAINPFSHQQVPTSERMGVGIRYGSKFYRDEPYPNSAHFDHGWASHYDPLADDRFTPKPNTTNFKSRLAYVNVKLIPRFCERQITTYKRCLIANDERQDVCQEEQDNIVAICPSWALHNLKERNLNLLKNEALNNKQYREAMEVSSYNQGRTVADVPLRSWKDGNRDNLRPNTLWADDRYADITQKEIDAAKERVKRRREAHPEPKASIPTYDRKYEVPPREVPLYSV